MPWLVGLGAAIAVYLLLVVSNGMALREIARNESLQRLAIVRAGLSYSWNRAASWAEYASRQLLGADAVRGGQVIEYYKALWPEASFALYNRQGDVLRVPAKSFSEASVPLAHTARSLVQKALVGQSAQDITKTRGFLSLSAAVPIHSGEARALLVSVPLDPFILSEVKTLSGAEVAVLPFDDVNTMAISDVSSAANTFSQSQGTLAELWPEIGTALSGMRYIREQTLAFRDETVQVAVGPLAGAGGSVLGVLAVAPSYPPEHMHPFWYIPISVLAGLAAALVAAYCLHRRGQRISLAVAEGLAGLAAVQAGAREWDWSAAKWPASLEKSFSSLAASMHECRTKAKEAEFAREKALAHRVDCAQREEEPYLRLFSSLPVGAFQIEGSGRFIRINQTFAMLLGYDSTALLLAENVSFTEFCLYGDEIRNPFKVLSEAGGGSQIISLRRRDGRIGHFALICFSLIAVDGENSGVLEGFLVDRELEERLAKAEREREYANKDRSSLALLLAAICRQTQSYLNAPRDAGFFALEASDEPEGCTGFPGAADGAGPQPERRKSVLSAKAVLSDIYQIAVTEAEHLPPVAVPIDFERFLTRLCRQALPAMAARGISLRCEVARELLLRFSGPAPLLRHALQRALLAIAAPVRGGWICMSVSRDPNSPRSVGVSRILISTSWSSFSPDASSGHIPFGDAPDPGMEDSFVAFEVPVEPESIDPAKIIDPGTLDIADEQEVIRYLAQRMHGNLLEGVFTNELRSIRFTVPLEHLTVSPEDELGLEGAPAPEEAAGEAYKPRLQEQEQAPLSMAAVAALGVEAAPSGFDLLEVVEAEDTSVAAEKEEETGLDILLIDSSLNNRLLFSMFLRDTKHRITEAHDGQEGVETFKRGQFDIIFMDMEMPLMDGYQATRIIRALEAESQQEQTPIVAMTTYALPEFRRQCLLSGCSEFLTKPFSKIALFSKLDAFMELKHESACK